MQLGTEGLAIAQTVAARLGFHYLDWNDTARAASDAGVSPEAVNEFERNRPRLLRIVDKLLGSASMVSDEVTSDASVDLLLASHQKWHEQQQKPSKQPVETTSSPEYCIKSIPTAAEEK